MRNSNITKNRIRVALSTPLVAVSRVIGLGPSLFGSVHGVVHLASTCCVGKPTVEFATAGRGDARCQHRQMKIRPLAPRRF